MFRFTDTVAQLVFQFKIWVFKVSNDAEVYRIRFNYIYRGIHKERGGVIFEKLVDKHAIKQENQREPPRLLYKITTPSTPKALFSKKTFVPPRM